MRSQVKQNIWKLPDSIKTGMLIKSEAESIS